MTHSFNIIDEYISKMKALSPEAYNNATIIITGDHAYTDDNFDLLSKAKLTTLFVKPSGTYEGSMRTNTLPVSHEDLWSTIFTSEGIEYDTGWFGKSIFDLNEYEERERRFIWHKVSRSQTSFTEKIYKINGLAKDFNNWELKPEFDRTFNRELYD